MVQNMAIAVCRLADRTIIQLSAEVEALTGLKEPEPPVSAPGSDCCIRTLTGKGEGIAEYTLEYCHIHEPVAQQVRGMIAAAGGNPGESVWKQASELWRTAIDEEYAAMSVSDEYRSAFYAWLGEYEAYLKAEYPEDTAMVAMRISEQLMNFCADLCYLNGTAPADRVDSLLTGRYQALAAATDAEACYRTVTDGGIVSYAEILCAEHRVPDTELAGALSVAASAQEKTEAFRKNRQNWLDELSRHATEKIMSSMDTDKAVLILNERNAFDRMLLAEESFLTGFYPGRPEVVQEIVANSAREHVIDFCG